MIERQILQKPGIWEWARAGDSLACRLTEAVHIYKRKLDVFMSEAERQSRTDRAINILHRLHALLDRAEMPVDFVPGEEDRDEQTIDGFMSLFREVLKDLPLFSSDMQKLMKSPWMKNFPSKIAETLFRGESDESQGLGSGCPEHGRLPGVLAALIEREEMGDVRPPREEALFEEPRRHVIDTSARWVEQNASFLRTAGRVE